MNKISWPEYMNLPPEKAIAYLRKKGYKITFDHKEMQREEHIYNFTVAKATSLEILQDIRAEVDKALSEGTTLNTFQKNLRPLLQEKGWWGKKVMTDPKTGEEKLVQLGSSRRLAIIFDTNLRMAYAAGRWEGIQETKDLRPFLRYVSILDGRTRPQHRSWNDVVKLADDPWWDTHYPPNGWRCRCSVQQLSARDLKKQGLEVTTTTPDGLERKFVDKKTGDTITVPQGIDPGFAYNVGKARMKAMVPPPLDLPLATPFLGNPIDVPPPAPRAFQKNRLLPDGLTNEEYVNAFLGEFGGEIGKPVFFKDVTGEIIIISDDLFRDGSGAFKITKRNRHRYLLILADAIKYPDEVFVVWQEYPKGRMTLSRHYLVQWEDDPHDGFTMFDVSRRGWSGVTSFNTHSRDYILRQRVGSLVYRRPDNKKK
jgi:SPP1 gp7 family putative phage head morphogenesis protein